MGRRLCVFEEEDWLSSFDCSLIDAGYSHGGRVCKTRRGCK